MNSIVTPNVRRVIKQKCLKQAAIAEKAGYTPNQFSAMLNGRKFIKDVDIVNSNFCASPRAIFIAIKRREPV